MIIAGAGVMMAGAAGADQDDRGYGVPNSPLLPPGECRVWYPDQPPPPTDHRPAKRKAYREGGRVIYRDHGRHDDRDDRRYDPHYSDALGGVLGRDSRPRDWGGQQLPPQSRRPPDLGRG